MTSIGARAIGGPTPAREELLHTPDDEWLHLEHFDAVSPPARLIVVFVHGFSAYATPYRHVAQALCEVGCAVTLYDARGHGHSTGRRGYVARFADYAEDLERVVAIAQAAHPGLPFALIGHSQGGAVLLDYLLPERPQPQRPVPACAVLAAPMLEITVPIPWVKRIFSHVFGPLFPRVALGNGITGEMASRNDDVRRAIMRDPLIHHVGTYRWFSEATGTMRRLNFSAEKLNVPTLLMTAGSDRIVSPQAQDVFARRAPTALLEQRRYPALFHEVFLEPERDQLVDDMTAWIVSMTRGRYGDAATGMSGR